MPIQPGKAALPGRLLSCFLVIDFSICMESPLSLFLVWLAALGDTAAPAVAGADKSAAAAPGSATDRPPASNCGASRGAHGAHGAPQAPRMPASAHTHHNAPAAAPERAHARRPRVVG
jgi:hypothetical protein